MSFAKHSELMNTVAARVWNSSSDFGNGIMETKHGLATGCQQFLAADVPPSLSFKRHKSRKSCVKTRCPPSTALISEDDSALSQTQIGMAVDSRCHG